MSDTALPAIFRFDTTAARLAFTPSPGVPEQLYIWLDSDDEPNAYYWDGAAWQALNSGTVSTAVKTRQIGITIDGGGSAITTGVKGYKSFPVAGTITGARLLADQSGSIVIDVWKDTYANYPPTVADTITASAKPTLSAAQKSDDTTLTGWTTSVSAGDVFGFKVDSATTVTRVTLELTIVVT